MVTAGFLKITDSVGSVLAVRAYQLMPDNIAQYIGYALPYVEVGLGLMLILGFATRFTALATGALLVVFLFGISTAWARGLSIDCGCFGGGGNVDPAGKAWRYASELLRDTGFLILALFIAKYPFSRFSLDRFLFTNPEGTSS